MASKIIKKAVEELKKGNLIIYPTESSYAIGADYTNREAVNKVFELKNRPHEKKFNVIVSSLRVAKEQATLNKLEEQIVKELMPAPLTLVARRKIPDELGPEISFRIPAHKTALALAKEFKKPIVSTSANISGEKPIFNPEEIRKKFPGIYLIDEGELQEKEPSTVIRVYKGYLEILRKGAYPLQKIYYLVGKKLL